MNISEKLALLFIEKHFHYFDTKVESGTTLKSTDIQFCTKLTNHVTVFKYYRHELFVCLPETLNPESASKKRMINKVQNKNISFDNIDLYDWRWYRVTQNRLDALEEIMHNSGMTVSSDTYKFDDQDVVKFDKEDNEICTYAQKMLSVLNGCRLMGEAYFPAKDVEELCKKCDLLYSDILRQKDEQLNKIDPKTVEFNSKALEISNTMLNTAIDALNSMFDRLTAIVKDR